MKSKFNFLIFVFLVLIFYGCGREVFKNEVNTNFNPGMYSAAEAALLDELAELERSGSWIEGMALTESGLRESAGDFAGAVVAAYKELAHAYGKGLIGRDEMENGILNVLASGSNTAVIIAANAVLSFINGDWNDAAFNLNSLFSGLSEPDSFVSWMILVCELEINSEDARAVQAYKSIRARYAQFPEYWYRGARAFSGAVAAGFAENCINSSGDGPFAGECRSIIAAYAGLKEEDSSSVKTLLEIELIIYQSVNSGDPHALDPLLPLISLPDNSYTIYAAGALRALTALPDFLEYFSAQAAAAGGRLAERLFYICSG